MANEKILEYFMKASLKNNALALKKAQNRFVDMHYENAKLIGSKGFTNLMGKIFELGNEEFEKLVKSISDSSDKGSEIVFDYYENTSYAKIQKMMSRCGYLIYEHLDSKEMAELDAPAGFHFVLAVKKEHLE